MYMVYLHVQCMHIEQTEIKYIHVKIYVCDYSNLSVQRLTWHDVIIPQNEVLVTVGGDKGGSSYNWPTHPFQTPLKMLIFTVFKTKDSTTNLHVTLERYRHPVTVHIMAVSTCEIYCTCTVYQGRT